MNNEFLLILFALVLSIVSIILLNRYLNLHAFFCLLIASFILGLFTGKSLSEIIAAMQSGFGSLLQQIGFIVAIGSCMGIVLEKTGAMKSISEKLIYFFGARHSALALTAIGLLVGIPVFCDSGFIILSRLIPSIAANASVPAASLSLSLSSGLYTTHILVPPTPGPLAAAANLGLTEHLGQVILTGIVASLPVGLVAWMFAKKMGAKIISVSATNQDENNIPKVSSWKAILPLIIPILLITTGTLPKSLGASGFIGDFFIAAGQPVIALLVGLVLSFTLIQRKQKDQWPTWISVAIKDAGVILLITGAGGAFGFVIRSVGIDHYLQDYISNYNARGIAFLLAAYGIAAMLKTAQGSSTSSLIITSSLLAPLAVAAGFQTPTQLSFLVLAIGAGGMTVSHANDSYFWVVSQFGGINTRDNFKSFTVITFIQGLTTLAMTILLFLLW